MPLVLAAVLGAAAAPARADCARAGSSGDDTWQPDGLWLQWGRAQDTRTLTLGLVWCGPPSWELGRYAGGRFELQLGAGIGRWSARDEHTRSSAVVSQIGVTPLLRWRGDEGRSPWFVEGGIGVNWIVPLYRGNGKRFGSAFNFGDHVAVGRDFGPAREHEWSLRLQHYSNAGLSRPNPGENFVQLRYLHRW